MDSSGSADTTSNANAFNAGTLNASASNACAFNASAFNASASNVPPTYNTSTGQHVICTTRDISMGASVGIARGANTSTGQISAIPPGLNNRVCARREEHGASAMAAPTPTTATAPPTTHFSTMAANGANNQSASSASGDAPERRPTTTPTNAPDAPPASHAHPPTNTHTHAGNNQQPTADITRPTITTTVVSTPTIGGPETNAVMEEQAAPTKGAKGTGRCTGGKPAGVHHTLQRNVAPRTGRDNSARPNDNANDGSPTDDQSNALQQGLEMLTIGDPTELSRTGLLRELLEQEMLAHFDYVHAMRQTQNEPLNIQPDRILLNWKSLETGLKALAFVPGASCPWIRLGVARDEGPPPSLEQIERRPRLGNLLASAAQEPTWSDSDQASAAGFQMETESARKACIEKLNDVLRTRRRTKGWQLPRWQEPGPELLCYVADRARNAGTNWGVALHLSNLLGVDFASTPHILPPAESRRILDALCKGPSKGVEALSKFQGGGVVTWAPQESDALQRLVAAFVKHATEAIPGSGCQLVLLVPHDPYPECDSPAQVLDLWWHPILGDRYSDVVKEVTFLRQPCCNVFSGIASPTYHNKAIVMITLGAHPQASPPAMIQWRPTLLTTGGNFTVIVDCPAADMLKTRRALTQAAAHGLARWEGPMRSFGTQGSDRRICFFGYFPKDKTTRLDVRLCIEGLKRRPDLKGALVGSQDLFSDSRALLADILHPSGSTRIADLCEQSVFVSPKLMLLHTSEPKDVWELRLTELMLEDASKAIDRLRWRKSGHGGRVFAKPLALDAQIRAAQATARTRNNTGIEYDPSLSSMIVIRGALGANPDQLVEDLMAIIASRIGLVLSRGECERNLKPGQWRQVVDGAGQCTGSVRLVLASLVEVRSLGSNVSATAVEINGHVQHIEVHNALLVPSIPEPTTARASSSTGTEPMGNGNGSQDMQAVLLPGPPGLY